MVQLSQQVWSAAELPSLSESRWVVRTRAASPNGRRLSASDAGDHNSPSLLDSDKYGDEAAAQTGGLIESCVVMGIVINSLFIIIRILLYGILNVYREPV